MMAMVIGMGCARSPRYKNEQSYVTRDSRAMDTDRSQAANRGDRFGAPKKRVLALAFENLTPFGKRPGTVGGVEADPYGAFGADVLLRELSNTGRAIIPFDTKPTATSQEFFVGEKVKVSQLAREARRMNVNIIVIGRIHRIRYRQKGDPVGFLRKRESLAQLDLEVRVYDVTEAKELLAHRQVFESTASKINLFDTNESVSDTAEAREELVKDALGEGARQLAKMLARALDKVAWEGRIAKIQGAYIYINAGKRSGISLGDILKVITLGDDVYDPVTGAYMGKSRGQVKGTLEVIDYMGDDGAVTKVHSGAAFSLDDIVQLY